MEKFSTFGGLPNLPLCQGVPQSINVWENCCRLIMLKNQFCTNLMATVCGNGETKSFIFDSSFLGQSFDLLHHLIKVTSLTLELKITWDHMGSCIFPY